MWYGWGIYALIVGQAAGQGLMILGAILVLARRLSPRLDLRMVRAPLKFGYLSLPAAYGGVLLQTSDRFVINIIASTAHVGLYAFGSLLANVITIAFARPFIKGISPIVHQLEERPDIQRRLIIKIALYGSWAGTLMAVGLGCFAKELVFLLAQSSEYYAAWTVIPVLVFARVLQPLSAVMGMGLYFANRPGIHSAITLMIVALNLVANIALVPSMGILGAAVGTLIAMLAWLGINAYFAMKHYDLHFTLWRILAGIGLGGLFVSLALMIPQSLPMWLLLLGKGCCVAAYPLALLASGLVTRPDRGVLMQMYHQARHHGIKGLLVVFVAG
jgi:O-antigen/teichoic acid export membrane protein